MKIGNRLRCTLTVALLAVHATQAGAQNGAGSTPLVLRGVTVIDGTGRPAQPDRSVVITNGRIVAVEAATAPPPRGASVLDLPGRFVIPGLVDGHVHVTSPFIIPAQQDSMLALLFASGVTTVRDLAGDAVMLRERARLALAAELPSPRIHYSALMGGYDFVRNEPRAARIARGEVPGEVAWLRGLRDSTDLVAAVSAAKQIGATGIKLYADLSAGLVEKVTAEAHRQGLQVWSHAAIVPARPSDIVTAGVDVISHIDMLVYEGNDTLPGSIRSIRGIANYAGVDLYGPVMTRLLQMMKQRGTMIDATLFMVNRAGERDNANPWIREWGFGVARRAHALGIPFVTGTDMMGRPGMDAVSYLHDELELMVSKAGFSTLEAITAATLHGARAVGREREQGTIEPGKLADLVILAADPSTDIRNTRKIVYVLKGGVMHKPALAEHIEQLARSRTLESVASRDTLTWGESWPGTQMAIISGDPNVSGREFRFRFRMPDDYWIPPHTHPTRATIRVISGTFLVGMGEHTEEARTRAYQSGDTVVLEQGMAHFEGTRGLTIIELSGIGPWGIRFLDPNASPGVRRR